ncbi:putative chromosome transmission fidelity protein 8 [Cocos nucifera]|uniref:Putative chromosome transmission fidelity protein 8 n=1 Tax=Cocos nucifera TaxID=13894 RepID=A0A8K0N5B0_COCNU|nr:putative chromosome transmission fidelity protein 8 [Cocos nucifera]
MQIRIRCNCGEGACAEWAVVELQGVVEPQPSIGDQIQGLEIGRLCCTSSSSSSQGSYTFTVGYHELTGSRVALKKPLLVLKKMKAVGGEGTGAELEVIGVIRHKILFKSRPKALISTELFPDRTDVQCLHRWQKVLNPELVKGTWTKEEDDLIIQLVEKHGCKKWSVIAKSLPGRIGKQLVLMKTSDSNEFDILKQLPFLLL